jgi:hypothetical protein
MGSQRDLRKSLEGLVFTGFSSLQRRGSRALKGVAADRFSTIAAMFVGTRHVLW